MPKKHQGYVLCHVVTATSIKDYKNPVIAGKRIETEECRQQAARIAGEAPQESAVTTKKKTLNEFQLPSLYRHGRKHVLAVNGTDYTRFCESIDFIEEKGKDKKVTITLDNTYGELTGDSNLKYGKKLEFELFDGVRSRVFSGLQIANISRDYSNSLKIKLEGKTKMLNMQISHRNKVWEEVSDADIIKEIATAYGLGANIDEKTLGLTIPRVRAMANMSPMHFMRRIAHERGFELTVEDDMIYFKPGQLNDTEIVLKYRPAPPEIGSIISASIRDGNVSNKGSKSKSITTGTDYKSGTVDSQTGNQIANKGAKDGKLEKEDGGFFSEMFEDLGSKVSEWAGSAAADELSKENAALFEEAEKNWRTYNDGSSGPNQSSEEARIMQASKQAVDKYKYELKLKTYGQVDINLRDAINVHGLGSVDSGRWLVWKVQHKYDASGYILNVECKRVLQGASNKGSDNVGGTDDGTSLPYIYVGTQKEGDPIHILEETRPNLFANTSNSSKRSNVPPGKK